MISRRTALRWLLASTAAAGTAGRATASWEASAVGVCLVDPGWGATPREQAFADLLTELGQLTTVPVDPKPRIRTLADPAILREPMLALAGAEGFSPPADDAVDRLRRHLYAGAFLLIDDTSGLEQSAFADSVTALLSRLFPDQPLRALGFDHAVFRSFFLLDGAAGRFALWPFLEGVTVGDITPVVVSRNDVSGAWTRAPGGGFAREVVPGGERQRLRAIELGINVLMYALTANYKRDAVHVEALLQRMREEGRIP
jgi:hypothetical protein